MSRSVRSQAGDTIVEVLIAIAVASAVIGGAFVVVNRTLNNARQAQEHAEALKVAEGQLEHLKAYSQDHATDVTSTVYKVHCFDKNTDAFVNFPLLSSLSDQPSHPTPDNYPPGCKDINTVKYRTGIEYEPHGIGNPYDDVYTIDVDWPGVTGGQDHVSLVYKVVPE